MEFAGLNYWAVLLAAVTAFIIGSAYYGVLGRYWMRAARIDPERGSPSPGVFVISFGCELVMAWVLAGVIGHLGDGQVTIRNGLISGLFVWIGFVATTVTINQRYEGFGWALTLIDAGHWLLVLLAMGAVIGFMGV